MIEINSYLNDGANWQAQAVLAYLRNRFECDVKDKYFDTDEYNRIHCEVGRFENCREQGYVVTISYRWEQRHFAFFEHRNSDAIVVYVSDTQTINTPTIHEVYNSRGGSDYDYHFYYGEIMKCGNKILSLMKKYIDEKIEENKNKVGK